MGVENENEGTVQFLKRGYNNVFKWPQVEDVDRIDGKYVFASNFGVLSVNGGRTWSVDDFSYLKELYEQYCDIYFSPSADIDI